MSDRLKFSAQVRPDDIAVSGDRYLQAVEAAHAEVAATLRFKGSVSESDMASACRGMREAARGNPAVLDQRFRTAESRLPGRVAGGVARAPSARNEHWRVALHGMTVQCTGEAARFERSHAPWGATAECMRKAALADAGDGHSGDWLASVLQFRRVVPWAALACRAFDSGMPPPELLLLPFGSGAFVARVARGGGPNAAGAFATSHGVELETVGESWSHRLLCVNHIDRLDMSAEMRRVSEDCGEAMEAAVRELREAGSESDLFRVLPRPERSRDADACARDTMAYVRERLVGEAPWVKNAPPEKVP